MPGGDRTGPMGMGPMTGRAAGYCAGYGVPGYMNPMGGRGFGFGFGRGRGRGGGRGWRHWYYATGLPGWARAGWGMPGWGAPAWGVPPAAPGQAPTRDVELEALKAQAQYFENSLSEIKSRIEELESQQQQADTQ
jgi:hypothetical protein